MGQVRWPAQEAASRPPRVIVGWASSPPGSERPLTNSLHNEFCKTNSRPVGTIGAINYEDWSFQVLSSSQWDGGSPVRRTASNMEKLLRRSLAGLLIDDVLRVPVRPIYVMLTSPLLVLAMGGRCAAESGREVAN
jgi:hypothetical protein